MAKNVFLKIYVEEGQRHCVLDEANYKKKRPGYLLFADKCIAPIRDDDANALVRQNEHILSFEPMSPAALKKAIARNERPSKSPDPVSRRVLDSDLNEDEITTLEVKAEENLFKTPPKASAKKETKKAADVETKEVEITGAIKDVLVDLAKMSDDEFQALKAAEVRSFGESLGIKIPVTVKKADALKVLNSRAAELMARVKSDADDYDADE